VFAMFSSTVCAVLCLHVVFNAVEVVTLHT